MFFRKGRFGKLYHAFELKHPKEKLIVKISKLQKINFESQKCELEFFKK